MGRALISNWRGEGGRFVDRRGCRHSSGVGIATPTSPFRVSNSLTIREMEQARRQSGPERASFLKREGIAFVVLLILASVFLLASAARETVLQETRGPDEYAMSHCPPVGEGVDRACFDKLSVAGPLDVAPVGYGLAFLTGAAAIATLWFVTRDRRRGRALTVVALVIFVAFWGLLLFWNQARHSWRVEQSRITTLVSVSPATSPTSP